MPRQAREKSNTSIYHVMIRGISRQTIFEDDNDYTKMIEIIRTGKQNSEFKLYGYCLMTNHVHLLISEGSQSISLTMQKINSKYANCYNKKHNRSGHLFHERYKSEPIEDLTNMLIVLRCIHQNPVRAGITKTITDYKWTSYHEFINEAKLIETEFILALFSSEKQEAIKKLQAYMHESNEDSCLEYQETKTLTDDEVKDIILKNHAIKADKFHLLNKKRQNEIIKSIKAIEGTSIRQIARVTGASKYMVEKVGVGTVIWFAMHVAELTV